PESIGGAHRWLSGDNAPLARVQAEANPTAQTPPSPRTYVVDPSSDLLGQGLVTERLAPAPTTPDAAPPLTSDRADWRTYDGRPIRPVRTIRLETTAYSPDEKSCGHFADGMTASGYSVWTNGMRLAAADTDLLPFGTILTVPGYNDERPIPVLDRGGAIKGHKLDLLYATHERALQWGRQSLEVTVWEYADED
ncbi:MAG: 3D domain-containing protein, partial [Planctomycetota bacterium]